MHYQLTVLLLTVLQDTSTHSSPHENQENTSRPSSRSSFGRRTPAAAAAARSNGCKQPQISTPDARELGFDLPCTPRHPIPKVAAPHSAPLPLPPLDYPALHPRATTMLVPTALSEGKCPSPHCFSSVFSLASPPVDPVSPSPNARTPPANMPLWHRTCPAPKAAMTAGLWIPKPPEHVRAPRYPPFPY